MKFYFFGSILIALFLLALPGCDMPLPDLGFENPDSSRVVPLDWQLEGRLNSDGLYSIRLDSVKVLEGKYSLCLDYGTATYLLPAGYRGDSLELRGFLLTESSEDIASRGLFLKTRDGEGDLHSRYTVNSKIIPDGEWHEHSFKIPLDRYSKEIVFGAYYYGVGTMWVDDLQLFLDGRPLERIRRKEMLSYPALGDSIFFSGSGIFIDSLNKLQLDILNMVGKIWGFVKYYHPNVAGGDFNMDAELFRFLPEVLEASGPEEFNEGVLDWISSFGKVRDCKTSSDEISGEHKLLPDLAWMSSNLIGDDLRDELRHILKNRNQKQHIYLGVNPVIGNPVFKHEEKYPDFLYPDDGYRLLSLFRYWNMIQYFFPYKNLIEEDWNMILPEFIPQILDATDELEYRLVLLQLIGRIQDTHAQIGKQDSILEAYFGRYFAPVQLRFIEDRAVVAGYYNDALGRWSGLQQGDVILSIDEKEVAELVRERLPFYPASNYPGKLRDVAKNLLRGSTEGVKIKFQRVNEIRERTISRYTEDKIDFSLDFSINYPAISYELINDSIGYIYLGNIKNEQLDEIFTLFGNTRGIIIDIRNYPSEFVVFTLGEYLMPEPLEFVKFTNPDISYPGLFRWIDPPAVGETNPDYYKGKVVILVNEITQSQAEYTAMALRTAPGAIVLGSTTAGADGNVSGIWLPGNIYTMISGIGVYYPDGGETQRVGIIPDIEVSPTIQGIREGRDELLEKAIELIENSDL